MRKRKTWPKRFVDGFTNIPNFVLASTAVRTLQPSQFMVLMYLTMRCFSSKNNGEIGFANRTGCLWPDKITGKWSELEFGGATGLSKTTIGNALRELERRGLVECTKRSTFHQKRLSKEYRLTWVKTATGGPTNDFLYFKQDQPKIEPRPAHGPVMEPIGPSTDTPHTEGSPGESIQARQRACDKRIRPTSGPHSSHVLGSVQHAMNDIAAGVEAAINETEPRAAKLPISSKRA